LKSGLTVQCDEGVLADTPNSFLHLLCGGATKFHHCQEASSAKFLALGFANPSDLKKIIVHDDGVVARTTTLTTAGWIAFTTPRHY
jgi:hypothetical protein